MRDYVRKLHRESRQPDEEHLQYEDDQGVKPSPYSSRERAFRSGAGLDEE